MGGLLTDPPPRDRPLTAAACAGLCAAAGGGTLAAVALATQGLAYPGYVSEAGVARRPARAPAEPTGPALATMEARRIGSIIVVDDAGFRYLDVAACTGTGSFTIISPIASRPPIRM